MEKRPLIFLPQCKTTLLQTLESTTVCTTSCCCKSFVCKQRFTKRGFVTTSSFFTNPLQSFALQGKDAFSTSSFSDITPAFQGNTKGGGETAAVPALVNERVKYTTDLARLATSNPILAFTLTVVMFSIAGIPPLAGFYSKAFLMFAAIGSANYVLAIIGVAMSVVSAFYYLRIVKIMYFESLATPGKRSAVNSSGSMLSFMQINKEISLVCAGTLSFLLFFSLHPKPVFLISQKAALLVS